MIKDFKLFQRRQNNWPTEIQRRARKKLLQLHAVTRLEDLRVPPGNRLEPLSGDRAEQWSIRVNDQYRICFRWEDGDAHGVEITDNHR
ncbi:MAG: type II toxin-antitoxin system RelE/ParE family toxin [Thermodesulfobacteriota bacterium]